MLFQFQGMSNSNKDATSDSPDYSVERAKETTILFLPGPAPSYLLFIVFGTTRPFRNHMYTTFVPQRWQKLADAPELIRASAFSPKQSSASTSRSHKAVFSSPSSTQQHISIQLADLEKGHVVSAHNDSDDTLPILPLMKPTYHRTQIRRATE